MRENLKWPHGKLLAFKIIVLLFGVFLSLLGAELVVRILAPQALVSDIVSESIASRVVHSTGALPSSSSTATHHSFFFNRRSPATSSRAILGRPPL